MNFICQTEGQRKMMQSDYVARLDLRFYIFKKRRTLKVRISHTDGLKCLFLSEQKHIYTFNDQHS